MPPARTSLRILATTDLHGRLLPEDDYAGAARPATGLAQAATLLDRLRDEAPGATLVVDNGDLMQGTLCSEWLAREEPGTVHPIVAALAALGYDAAAPGNHDFDYGRDALQAAMAAAPFPFVCANVRHAGDGGSWIAPWAIIPRNIGPGLAPLRIGVLGLLPTETAIWNRTALGDALIVEHMAEAAAREVPRLRAAGADLVVALCHSGLPRAPVVGTAESCPTLALARVPGLDALVLGHTHALFPDPARIAPADRDRGPVPIDHAAGRFGPCPAVQPGAHGTHVGLIDFDLAHDGRAWQVLSSQSRSVPVERGTPVHAAVVAAAGAVATRFAQAADSVVGHTRVRLSTHFARVAKTAIHDVVCDALRAEAARLLGTAPPRPILVALAPFRAGGDHGPSHYTHIAPGPLSLRQAASLYDYPNELRVLALTGDDVRQWLEQSASQFLTVTPGCRDQPLLDPDAPPYLFDMIDGLGYAVDPSRPPGHRIHDLRVDGRRLGATDTVHLVTSSFRVGGGGGVRAARSGAVVAAGDRPIQSVVLDHVRSGPLDPAPRERWRFAPLPDTAAWFLSAPGAGLHAAAVADRNIRPLGPGPGGFDRFELAF